MTHSELVVAAEKARNNNPDYRAVPYHKARNAHVDDLLAILRLHKPYPPTHPIWLGPDEKTWLCESCSKTVWPCPTVQIVADRLTGWGVL